MNIDLLIKMANEIGSFWGGEAGEEAGAKEVASHIRRFWEPRMRTQMYTYFEERQGSGLSDVAKKAIVLLMEQARLEKAAAEGAALQGGSVAAALGASLVAGASVAAGAPLGATGAAGGETPTGATARKAGGG